MAQRTPYRVAIALNSAEEQAWVQDRLEQSQGWQVLFSTKDGETCLRQVLRDRPELVLIGDILRDMEGRELLRQLRLRGMAGKLVLITNSLQIASSADVRQDADLCLLRPYNMEQLLRWMAEQAEGPSAEQLARYERAEAEAPGSCGSCRSCPIGKAMPTSATQWRWRYGTPGSCAAGAGTGASTGCCVSRKAKHFPTKR